MGWLAQGRSLEDVSAELEASGKRATQQLIDSMPSKKNYQLLRHVVGIERWGQSRLKVMLGEPLTLDDYDGYRPTQGMSWNELQDAFEATREETLQIIEELSAKEVEGVLVPHNEYGELTAVQWLVYLRNHANIELWKLN